MSRFLKGEWITCLDDTRISGSGLTLGQDYLITKDDNHASLVFITNDLGKEDCYHVTRFQKSVNAHSFRTPLFQARLQINKTARSLSMDTGAIKVEWIESGIGYMIFRLVSDLFTNVAIKRRHDVFDEALRRVCPKVIEEYQILYDTATTQETKLKAGDYY